MALIVLGCGEQGPKRPPAPDLARVEIRPAGATIEVGDSVDYTAYAIYTDGQEVEIVGEIEWVSSNPSIASVGSSGITSGFVPGTVEITATYEGVTGAATTTVTAATLESIEITTAEAPLPDGIAIDLTAIGTYSDGSTADITEQATWTSTIPAVGSVSNAAGTRGQVTGVGVGTATITATLGAESDEWALVVTDAVVVSLEVSPTAFTLPIGITQPFTAQGTFSDGQLMDLTNAVTWSSANETIATVSNDAATKGVATGVATGSTQIVATLGAVTDMTLLTVSSSVLLSIEITPDNPTIPDGTSQQFFAHGTYSGNATPLDITNTVTWSASPTTVATINGTGLATTVGNTAIGPTTITATLGPISDTTSLQVGPATLTSVLVTPENVDLPIGTDAQFFCDGIYSDGSTCTVGATCDVTLVATWTATPAGRLTVDADGLATAPPTGTTGAASVSCAIGSISDDVAVNVSGAVLSSILISSTPASPLPLGQPVAFTATGTLTDGATVDLSTAVTWSSTNTGVIAFDAQGNPTVVGAGFTEITGSQGLIISNTLPFTVNPATAPEITVTANGAHYSPGFSYVGQRNTGLSFSRSVIISNSGTANLSISSVAVGTTSNCTMTTGTPTSPILPSGLTSFSVSLQPIGFGDFACELLITSNDADEGVFSLTFEGVGVFALGTFDGFDGLFLGNGGCGITDFNLSTDGRLALTGFGTNPDPTVFLLGSSTTASTTNLDIFGVPGHACTVTKTGATTGTIDCNNRSGGTCTEPVTQQAAAEIKVLQAGTEILDGKRDAYQYATAGAQFMRTYTITNEGAANLTIGTITIACGTNCTATITQPAMTTLAMGQSTTFTVNLTPTAQGSFSSTVTIPNNDSDENPFDFVLRGAGI